MNNRYTLYNSTKRHKRTRVAVVAVATEATWLGDYSMVEPYAPNSILWTNTEA